MKIIMTAIAAIGAMTTFVGTAIADVSISIRFGSTPSVTTHRTYRSYGSPIRQTTYYNYNPYNYNPYNHYSNRSNYKIWNHPTRFPATTHSIYNPYQKSRFNNHYRTRDLIIRIR